MKLVQKLVYYIFLWIRHFDYLWWGVYKLRWQYFARYWPPPPVDICEGILSEMRENLHTVDIFSTTYLPRLVTVVCECPLIYFIKYLYNRSMNFLKSQFGVSNPFCVFRDRQRYLAQKLPKIIEHEKLELVLLKEKITKQRLKGFLSMASRWLMQILHIFEFCSAS